MSPMNNAIGANAIPAGLREYRIQSGFWKLHEHDGGNGPEFLKPYFADLHAFFMNKMLALRDAASFSVEQEDRLKDLFREVLEIKAQLLGREDTM